jgi:GH35 family endo-1,4-beta-xylanase
LGWDVVNEAINYGGGGQDLRQTPWLNGWPSRRTNCPLLFDRQNKPKPAFDAVLQVVADPAVGP